MSSQRDFPLLHVHGSTVPNTRRPDRPTVRRLGHIGQQAMLVP